MTAKNQDVIIEKMEESINLLEKRINNIEQWKEVDIEPWRENIFLEIEDVKGTQYEQEKTLNKLKDTIVKLQNNSWCLFYRDVLILTTILLMIIFLIIFLV